MTIPAFFRKGRGRWVALVGILAVLAIGFWFSRRSSAPDEVTTVRPQQRDLTQVLEFSGVTDASERVALRFAAGGRLTYVGAKEGDAVQKWQTLATIDARSAQKTLEQQLNTYEGQRLTFENQSDDRKDQVLSTEANRVAQQDQIALEQTVLGVEIQSLAIEQTRLYSPIAGILIGAPNAVAGTNIGATDIYEVFNPTTVFFEAYVDEIDVSQVYVGQGAVIRLDAFSGEEFSGAVSKVAYRSAASTSGGTVFPIEIRFDTGTDLEKLRLGMNGEAKLIIDTRKNVLSLPVETITSRDGKSFVMIHQAGQEPQEREVQTGLETEDHIEILSGVTSEDEVILP